MSELPRTGGKFVVIVKDPDRGTDDNLGDIRAGNRVDKFMQWGKQMILNRAMRINFEPHVPPSSREWQIVNDCFLWFSDEWVYRRVSIARLIGTQPSVNLRGMQRAEWRKPIYVVRIGCKIYIRDGHHRVMRAKLRGQKTISAMVHTWKGQQSRIQTW